MIEAILWDNDGVLVDTEGLFFQSTRETLGRVGIELSFEQFLDISMRQGRSAFQLATARGATQEEIAELKRVRDTLYTELLREQTRVLTGIPEALQALHG